MLIQFYSFSYLITLICGFLLGFYIFTREKNKQNIIWGIMHLGVVLWSFGRYIQINTNSHQTAILASHVLLIGSLIIYPTLFHTTFIFIKRDLLKKWKILLSVLYVNSLILIAIEFWDIFNGGNTLIIEVIPKLDFKYYETFGVFLTSHLIVQLLFPVIGIYELIDYYLKADKSEKNRVKYFLLAIVFGIVGSTTVLGLSYNIPITPFGVLLIPLYLIMISFAIYKHRLMDINYFVSKSASFIFLLLLYVVPVLLVIIYLNKFLFSDSISWGTGTLLFLALALSGWVIPKLKQWTESTISKSFFKRKIEYDRVLSHLSQFINSTLNLKNVITEIMENLERVLKPEQYAFYIYNESKDSFSLQTELNFKKESEYKNISCDNPIIKYFLQNTNEIYLVVEEAIRTELFKQFQDLEIESKKFGMEVILPLRTEGRLIGLMSLGMKKSGFYSEEDLDLLFSVSNNAGMAINNAISYKKIEDLSINLENKVKERTIELEDAYDKLKELDEVKTNFLSNISHELRTPLTAISNPVEMILAGDLGTINDEVYDYLDVVKNNAYRLLRLINDLLDISKLESNKMELKYYKVAVVPYVDYLVKSIEPLVTNKNITLKKDYQIDNFDEFFDPNKIEKVIINLLSNAIKFTDNDGEIIISLKKENESFCLSVKDSGIGIDPKDHNKVFDRFSQVDSTFSRKHEGTGIGLALVKELVELHKGKISLASDIGKGSTFTVELPRVNQDEITVWTEYAIDDTDRRKEERRKNYDRRLNDRRDNEDRRVATSKENLLKAVMAEKGLSNIDKEKESLKLTKHIKILEGRPNLLLVDDNPDILRVLITTLKDDYNISFAFNGAEGFEKLNNERFDIVLSDIMMPKMNGIQLCEKIKLDDKLKYIPVILLTSKSDIESKILGYETGADDYVTKPFNANELKAKVKALLKLKMIIDEFNQNERMISVGRLAAGIAHEINNPLNYVINSIRPLKQNIAELTSQTDFIENEANKETITDISKCVDLIKDGCERTIKIVKDLRMFSRIDESVYIAVCVNEGIDLSLSLLEHLTKSKITIHKNYRTNNPIFCYSTLINQVFMNILTNASQAITDNQEKGNIWIETYEENDFTYIKIKNDGPKIPDELLKRIFDPFFTTKEIGVGSGLGLSISHGIIAKHDGKITAQNQKDGVLFTMSLPALKHNPIENQNKILSQEVNL
ncbi:MAG: ATP-binding protein [Pseudomonadota bacterium]